MLVVLWEFRVRQGCEAEFERVYGPDGEWSALFRDGKGYLGTELCLDENVPRRYITIDRWDSSEAYREFRRANRHAYDALDARCQGLTESEPDLGTFVIKG